MNEYIQRGERTRYRNHLMVERIQVCYVEDTWVEKLTRALAFLSVVVLVGLVLTMGIMSLQGLV